VFAASLARNAQKCRKALAQMVMLDAWHARTSFARFVTALSIKGLICALNVKIFLVKPPRKDQ
jgi:hypothetical protein